MNTRAAGLPPVGALVSARVVGAGWVTLAAVLVGLLFAPVFGVGALLLPVVVPAVVVFGVAWLASRGGLVPWRPLFTVLAGLVAVAATTLWPAGVPIAATPGALAGGVTQSWQLALQSTWPARPEPAVLLFVPLLVLVASVLGAELVLRQTKPLVALLPSLAVGVLGQFYVALSGWPAVLAAGAYALAAGGLLATVRNGPQRPGLAIVPVALCVACAVLAGVLLPSPQARYSLKDEQLAPLAPVRVANPLDEIAYRLAHPTAPVFTVRGGAGVDRWPVVVLDEFDGVNWSPGGRYRTLGTELRPSPEVTVPVEQRNARIESLDLGGPWLPSQTWPAGVSGAAPLVEEQQGTLLVPDDGRATGYDLTWWAPRIPAGSLLGANIDATAPGGLSGVGAVPPGIAELAERAVSGIRPTFQAALALERYFRENYRWRPGRTCRPVTPGRS